MKYIQQLFLLADPNTFPLLQDGDVCGKFSFEKNDTTQPDRYANSDCATKGKYEQQQEEKK